MECILSTPRCCNAVRVVVVVVRAGSVLASGLLISTRRSSCAAIRRPARNGFGWRKIQQQTACGSPSANRR